MKAFFSAAAAAVTLVAAAPVAAQTTAAPAPAYPPIPQGVAADRTALTAMDYIEIQMLYARHSLALDTGNGAMRATLFTPDGSYANYPSKHVPVPVAELARRTTAAGNTGERHLVTNIVITPTKEGADGFAYLTYIDPKGGIHPGFYKDKLVKTADGWKFGARQGWYDVDPESPYRGKRDGDAAAVSHTPSK